MTPPKINLQVRISPEELFAEALSKNGANLSGADLRLLLSGVTALREAHEKPLNKIETVAVAGVIAYVAYTQDVSEEKVTAILTSQFNVKDIKELPSKRYNDIIEYLVDLQMDTIYN